MVTRVTLAATLLLAGCYAPSVAPGAPCSESGACPSAQECRSGICYPVGAPHDGGDELGDGEVDASTLDASPDAPGYIGWGAAVELATLESTGTAETDPSITADLKTVVFRADLPANDEQLFIATRTALTDSFTITELTALNATGFNETSPEISADGQTIYFISNRSGAYKVYSSTFTTVWSTPVLRSDLSPTGAAEDIAVSPDGLTAVVGAPGAQAIFRLHTRGSTSASFGNGVRLTDLEFRADIAAPTITNGGETIYFHAGAPRQLYRSTRKGNGGYTMPALVAEVNVAAIRTAAPFVLQSDETMIFERASDIFLTTRDLP